MQTLQSKEFTQSLLNQNIRTDGREIFQSRKVQIQFMDSPGNLLYRFGKTQILVKINTQIVMPKPQKPSQGFVHFKVNCMSCNNNVQQNKKIASQLQTLLQKVIVGSLCLDPQSLCILTSKYVWQLSISAIVIKDNGNVFDSILNGVMAGLMDMRKPVVNVQSKGVKLSQKLLPLSIAHIPISFTFGIQEQNLFYDPNNQQQQIEDSRITVSMNVYNQLCTIHKIGGKGISENAISGILRICQKQIKQKTLELRKLVQNRKLLRNCF